MTELIEYKSNLILVSLLITVCMQLCFFAIAYTLKMDKVTDFAGTSNFLVLAAFTLWLGNDFSLPKLLATLMVCLWGFRLGGYLFYRILIWGEDHRFDEMREAFWSFLRRWLCRCQRCTGGCACCGGRVCAGHYSWMSQSQRHTRSPS
mgnify:CR=1 FL=1